METHSDISLEMQPANQRDVTMKLITLNPSAIHVYILQMQEEWLVMMISALTIQTLGSRKKQEEVCVTWRVQWYPTHRTHRETLYMSTHGYDHASKSYGRVEVQWTMFKWIDSYNCKQDSNTLCLVGTHLFIKNNVRARLRHSQGPLELLGESTIEFGTGASILLDYSSRLDYDPWVNKIKSIPSYREIVVNGAIVGQLPPVRIDKPADVCDDIQVTTSVMSSKLYTSYKIVSRECEPENDENDDDAASGGGETSSSLGHVTEMSLIGLFIMGVMVWMN